MQPSPDSSTFSAAFAIRPVVAADRRALGQIAYETGFFGASAEVFFPDPKLFGELWVGPYLNDVGCCNFAAESEGTVVGYIIGACDTRVYQRYFARRFPKLVGQLIRGDYPYWRRSLSYLLRALRYSARAAPRADYPAHLHINLLPGARGHGSGGKLLAAFLGCLGERGVEGVQLSTTRENDGAIRLYERHGFEVYIEYESPLWHRWLGRNVSHVIMTKRL